MPAILAAPAIRAAVLTGPGRVAIERRSTPDIGPRQVRIQIEGCGVCGSNLPVWEGRPWFTYPLAPGAPGHEGWGRVDQVGDEVADLRPGDRVAVLSYHAFAEFDVADAASVVKLPDRLADRPFPGEALGCAINVFRRSDIRPEHTVAVVGVGFLGAVLVDLAARAGARVVAIARRPFAQALARRLGAREVVALDDDPGPAIHAVREITGGAGCERVIEATGLQGPLDVASEITAERGRLIVAGYHQDGLRQVNMQSWNWRGIDVVNAHERDPRVYADGMRAAVEAVASGQLDPFPLFTHEFSLEQTAAALDCMRQRPPDFLKALVTCR